MSKADITVKEIQIIYPLLNSDLKEESIKDYELAILGIYAEKCGSGFKVKKIYKTNKRGTKVKYEAIKDKDDFDNYIEKVKELINVHNEKYGTKLKIY